MWYQTKWNKIIPIIYGMTFFIRRVNFIITVMFLNDYLLIQLSLQIAISLINLLFLVKWKPLKSNKKEIFNEVTILFLSYFALTFTDAEPDPNTRSIYGFVYMCLSLQNILVHLILLLINTISNLINFVRR